MSCMYTIILVALLKFIYIKCDNSQKHEINYELTNFNVSQITDAIVALLNVDKENKRFQELTEKLNKINEYVIDKDTFGEIVRNETIDTALNSTNFYESLSDNDYYRFLTNNDTNNLYFQLKQRMNRDDIIHILSKHNKHDQIAQSARKALTQVDQVMGANMDNVVDEVIDRILAAKPKDDHKFDLENTSNVNIRFDPKNELEDLKEHHKHDGRRIYQGERTSVRAYPFMVSLHIMEKFWCGGVLHFHDIVLTSASCLQLIHNNRFYRENPRVLSIRVGSNHSRIGGEMVDALEVYFHPSYNPHTLRNNIAVIRLRRSIIMNYHRVPKIIDISRHKVSMPTTAEILILGWGVTKVSQKLPYEPVFLQRKFLPIYPNVFCKEVYGERFIASTMFCAGTFSTGDGACDHDAGGPAILSGYLVGIISFGPALCGFPNAPTVFTLVGAYADWIDSIRNNMPSYYRGRQGTTTTTLSPFQQLIRYSHYPMAYKLTSTAKHMLQPGTTEENVVAKHQTEDDAPLEDETTTTTESLLETTTTEMTPTTEPHATTTTVATTTTTTEPTTDKATPEEKKEEKEEKEESPLPALRKKKKAKKRSEKKKGKSKTTLPWSIDLEDWDI